MKRKDILLLLISISILIFAWIGFSIYHNYATSTVTSTIEEQIQPISPNFDQRAIEKLKTRKKVAPNFTAPVPASTQSAQNSITPTSNPSPTAAPLASGSAVIASPAPTQGGIL